MSGYWLYCLDEAGKISQSEWLEACNDGEAIALAHAKNKPVRCELWERDRLVASIPAQRP
jgi:hypothetical protein